MGQTLAVFCAVSEWNMRRQIEITEARGIFFASQWQKAVDQSNSYKVSTKYDVMSLSEQLLTDALMMFIN